MPSNHKDDEFDDLPEPAVSPLEEEAIRWLVRLTSGEANAAERAQFERWSNQSPEHRAALRNARQLWASLEGVLVEPQEEAPPAAPVAKKAVEAPSRRSSMFRYFALAASLLLGAGVAYQSLHDWRHDYVTATGRQEQIKLADNSTVTLNTDTAIDVQYSALERRVVLARGEAFFDVAHNPDLPFIVRAGEGEVRVLGTAFSVRKDGDQLLVTVERGRVEVRAGVDFVVLTPNQQVRFNGAVLREAQAIDSHSQLAWRRGRLIIEDQPLSQVISELDRYHPGMFVVTNDAVGSRRVNAVIDLAHIDDWLAALTDSQPIELHRYGFVTVIR
ncbi:FecR family protein [Peristeroidobacter soli]|uniref:FecR family protein n=1 Tax=Peristeroidobacter soli TaxID=2497877 RepID=UPI00101DF68A|nr:FecR family protein [Peristeroidobacter soli]